VDKVVGLRPGLYRYLALKHKLIEVDLEVRVQDEKVGNCLPQHFVKTSAVVFIWTVVVYRESWRYGDRGYRSLYIEAGHICQNLYLSAEAIKGGVCAIGAFRDQNINDLIGSDGSEQFVIYVATVGKKLNS
jgi:SagB-type dehydrogenase family enzyme